MSYDGYPSVKLKTKVLQDLFPDDNCILLPEGAMTTPGLLEDFALNPCHLGKDGKIRRYREVIGTLDDIEVEKLVVDAADVTWAPASFKNLKPL